MNIVLKVIINSTDNRAIFSSFDLNPCKKAWLTDQYSKKSIKKVSTLKPRKILKNVNAFCEILKFIKTE